MQIQDKRVVVTGAASGIGKALCEAFNNAGAKSVVCVDMNLYGSLYTLMSRYRKAVIHIYVDTFHIRYYFLSLAFV